MAKKANTKKRSNNLLTRNRVLIATAVLVLNGVFIYGITQEQQEENAERQKVSNLTLVAEDLSNLKSILKNNKLQAGVETSQYCQNEHQVYQSGPLYCYQQLKVINKYNNEPDLLNAINVVNDSLQDFRPDLINTGNSIDNLSTNKQGDTIYLKSGEVNPFCRMDYASHHFNRSALDRRGEFEFTLLCSERMKRPIYKLVD